MLKIFTYKIPFKKPFVTAKGSHKTRNGIILVFEHNGIEAYGEIAPLPGFSNYSIDQILPVLKINTKALENALIEDEFPQFFYVLSQIHSMPSLKFGLDTLYHDYQAKKAKKSLLSYLFKDSFQTKTAVNGTLGSTNNLEDSLNYASALYGKGYRTFKVKVGVNFKKEFDLLSSLRNNYPSVKIRIDANQSWSLKEAVSNLRSLEELDIEYCEEPLLISQIDKTKELKSTTKIKLAADESFRNKSDAIRLTGQNTVDVLVLKPMMFGSFSEINVTKELSDSHYNRLVFTTSLESIIGRTVTGILSMGWGAENYAHGLSTGSLFKNDVGSGFQIKNGFFAPSNEIGLGVNLNYNHLKEIT